jgi:hypothetical protein
MMRGQIRPDVRRDILAFDVLYIGKSTKLGRRLRQHGDLYQDLVSPHRQGPWLAKFLEEQYRRMLVAVWLVPGRWDTGKAEAALILALRPRFNEQTHGESDWPLRAPDIIDIDPCTFCPPDPRRTDTNHLIGDEGFGRLPDVHARSGVYAFYLDHARPWLVSPSSPKMSDERSHELFNGWMD